MAGTSSGNPDEMEAYVTAMRPADQCANDALAAVTTAAEHFNSRANAFGGKVDRSMLAAIDTAVNELSYLDLWVGRVATGFRQIEIMVAAGQPRPALIHAGDYQLSGAGPSSLAAAVAAGQFADLFKCFFTIK